MKIGIVGDCISGPANVVQDWNPTGLEGATKLNLDGQGFTITGGRMEDGKLVVDVRYPLRTFDWKVVSTDGSKTYLEARMIEPECCWLSRNAKEELERPGMSAGDQRAWMDRFGCKAKAKWVIYGLSDPYNVIESCDAHRVDLADCDDVVVPLGSGPL